MVAVPKPAPTTQAQRKAGRTPHPFKPPPKPKKPPKTLKRTGFAKKPGTWQLKRSAAKRAGVAAVRRQTGFTLARGQKLKPLGVRGRRLAPGDRVMALKAANEPCCCGCNQVAFAAHLISRGAEATRHEDSNWVAACTTLHPGWLDQGKGVKAKAELVELAQELKRHLVHEDVYPVLSKWGYYTDLYDRRMKER